MSVFDLAVVGPDAESQAAAAVLALAGGRLAPAVVVSDRGVTASLGLPATPAARRLAGLLGVDGAGVSARGRLVWVRPPRDELVRAARRVVARAQAPVVVALSAPRDEVADVLLAESLRVTVLAEPGGPVAALALTQLAAIGVLAEAQPTVAGPAISLARLGWAGSPAPALVARG